METFSLERVITVGDRKLTDMYRSSRDLGISREVVLKGFLRKARDVNELQKQIPLNMTQTKDIFDNCIYGNSLVRSPVESTESANVYNEIMFNMMNTYMYPATQSVEPGTITFSSVSSVVINSNEPSTQGYPPPSWTTESSIDFSFNNTPGIESFIPELSSTPTPQTTLSSDSLNYSFEQSSYYNYLSVPLPSEPMEEDASTSSIYSSAEHTTQETEDRSIESSPPFYSELSKALLLNESSDAQSSVGGDKRKRCYEEADIEAQLHQTKRVATV
ncbi:hypothetical protein K7432_008742 [Basidiobolus ranarum]|uniref:Uncharacterized protein n=1 Tax=Basidiobolus ranarum TaxID=34480 RepID=A0ABR2WRC9_9FUNG